MGNLYRHIAIICGLGFALLWANALPAVEQLTVEQLQKYHAAYHLRSVTLVGRVWNMHVQPPLQKAPSQTQPCTLWYGVAQFELDDDTGRIPVETLGSCSPTAMELPHDGKIIELKAKIYALVPEGEAEPVIKAVAERIAVLPPKF